MKTLSMTALALLGLTAAGDELTLRPRAGEEITRTFRYSSELILEGAEMLIDGEEMGEGGEMEQEMTDRFVLVVRDTIEEADGARATRFTREYETVTGASSFSMSDPMGGEHEEEASLVSDLEGCRVLFALEEGELTPAFAEEEGDGELLEDLTALLDLDGLLPDGAVAEGDSWEVDRQVILDLSSPGGDLHLHPEGGGEEMFFDPQAMTEEDDAEISGEVTARYLGVREEEGRRLAGVEITVDFSVLLDLTEAMQSMEGEGPDDVPEGMVMPEIESFEQETIREGTGVLLWNVETGTLHSFDLTCEVLEVQTMSMVMSMGEMEQAMEQIMTMSGSETYEVRFDG